MSRLTNTRWHRLLGKLLEELLTPHGITVLTEVPVLAEPPQADIILLRREGDHWTEDQKSRLADGLRDTSAKELLIEFKYSESLDEDAFLQALVYDFLFSRNKNRSRVTLQSFLISAKTPNSDILDRLGFRPTERVGVYTSQGPFVKVLQVILLNKLANTPHNAAFKCFASRQEEQTKAFHTIDRIDFYKTSNKLERIVSGLRRILMQNVMEDPDAEGWTPESVMELGREWIESAINAMSQEELFKLPGPAKALERSNAESRNEGEKNGEKNGEAKLLLRLMARRFGNMPSWVHKKVNMAEVETLEIWYDRVLDAATLEEVFDPSPVH